MYDGPNCARTEMRAPMLTGVASGTMTKFLFFAKTKIKKVHSLVCTAGTDTGAGIDIYNGTTSVGQIVQGTNTAGVTQSTSMLDTIIGPMGYLEIKGKANSATMVVCLTVEEEVVFDAAFS